MKRAYIKPDVLFEDFMMSTNIAAGCEAKPTNATWECGVKWSKGVIIFIGPETGCNTPVAENDAEYNYLCYHNPSSDYNVFMS